MDTIMMLICCAGNWLCALCLSDFHVACYIAGTVCNNTPTSQLAYVYMNA